MLADIFGIGRQVEDYLCTFQSQCRAGRYRRPYILTQLDSEAYIRRIEQQICTHRHHLTTPTYIHGIRMSHGRSKPALLVEFFIIRQISLRHNTQNLTFLKNHGTVHQRRIDHDRHTDNGNNVQLTGIIDNLHQSQFSLLKQ